ncbi:ubiquitin-associated protein 2-like [Centrocercus urophasianus]|uniref:ubiquitin-associated protein 2-like n=1 Tax=Centrocercus urophasianus TaxID=9002 RepID=UPI001C64683D|nr:ubiquitin-associated protein 2-like [Centrocercus urophasianus]
MVFSFLGFGRGRGRGARRFSAQGMGTFNPADYVESSADDFGTKSEIWEIGRNDADDGTDKSRQIFGMPEKFLKEIFLQASSNSPPQASRGSLRRRLQLGQCFKTDWSIRKVRRTEKL